jgi:hypothetical protein
MMKETPRLTPAPFLIQESASVGVGQIVGAEVRQPRSYFVPLFSFSLATKFVALFVKSLTYTKTRLNTTTVVVVANFMVKSFVYIK